jgi:4'-phosphopantetheinyl transferase
VPARLTSELFGSELFEGLRLELQPLDLRDSASVQRMGAELLSPAELARAAAMQPGAGVDFLSGRLALQHFAAALLDVPTSALAANYACPDCGSGPGLSHGRPGYLLDSYLLDGGAAPLLLSASRASGWILLAGVMEPSAGQALGVDLEDEARTVFPGFDEVALTPREKAAAAALPASQRARGKARLWARKEAWLKMTGQGLRMAPNSLDVLERDGIEDVPLPSGAGDRPVPHGLVAAVALHPSGGSSTR